EQEAIAEALSNADALIESLEQLIAKKRHIKQGAMQELLTGKKRLAEFSGDWEVKTFGEVFDYHSTATNSRNDLTEDGDSYYIHYGDIHTRFHNHLDFKIDQPPRIKRSKCRNATLVKNRDWVMADASEDFDGVGKSIEIIGLEEGTAAVAGLHTFLLREKTLTFAPGFKGHLGNLKSLHDQFLRVATGMKVFGVSKTALRDLLLPIPPPPEQTAIAIILSDMDAEIAALETRLAKTRALKQGMMHNLLTGRIRLIGTTITVDLSQ
ncbi:MAG: restriction endonuclease subunit S, partial [Methylococcales bacterium]|nr:restriction endonuclease subunit S [Methylococcales bacterium]